MRGPRRGILRHAPAPAADTLLASLPDEYGFQGNHPGNEGSLLRDGTNVPYGSRGQEEPLPRSCPGPDPGKGVLPCRPTSGSAGPAAGRALTDGQRPREAPRHAERPSASQSHWAKCPWLGWRSQPMTGREAPTTLDRPLRSRLAARSTSTQFGPCVTPVGEAGAHRASPHLHSH
jgi:hypothetical protein